MTSISPDALVTVGFRLGSGRILPLDQQSEVDIEQTLLDLVREVPGERRLAGVLLAWVKVHGNYVNVEKLKKLAQQESCKSGKGLVWLTAVAGWAVECGFDKWKRLIQALPEPVYLYSPEVTASAIALKGRTAWLSEIGFEVPEGSLRVREGDVMTPEDLVRVNRQYRNRYLYGPNWRADIITAIESGLESPTAIMRRVGCSYEPAHRVWREWQIAVAA
jgi:hypothetical protein